MTRWPVIPTAIVAMAIAAMIGLGIWQLDRRGEKAALIAQYRANLTKPVMAFPRFGGDAHLFRRASALCLEVIDWRTEGAGSLGWRHIADCRTGAEGPLLSIDMGVSKTPDRRPDWRGGEVTGTITTTRAEGSGLWRALTGGGQPVTLMLVAETPAPGFAPSRRPDPSAVPNNHLAYAVQWFLFAAIAGAIYVLALRRRGQRFDDKPRDAGAPPAP